MSTESKPEPTTAQLAAAKIIVSREWPDFPVDGIGEWETRNIVANAIAAAALQPQLRPTAEGWLAAVLALHVPHLCSCEGRRWDEDENWEPEDYQRGRPREEGAGLIPCGFCNHGGWNVDQWDKDGAVTCDHCNYKWPCPTVRAAGVS